MLIKALLLGAVALLFVCPFQTTVVPQWTVRLVNESGTPVGGLEVSERWRHYSVESADHEETLRTNADGYVAFSRRSVRASLLARTIGAMLNALAIHQDSGRRVDLDASGAYTTVTSHYYEVDHLPRTIVVRRLDH